MFLMNDTQKALQKQLLKFCALLPENGLAFAPIGTKVAKKPMHGTSPAPSREGADKHLLGFWIEDSHRDPISAIGLWTGPITRVLILDVDMDLAGLKEKYNELNSADQCVVTSPRENAAKFIYRLPESFDTTGLRSVSLSDTKKGYEILFNNNTQGIIFGKYNNGKGLTGDYTFHGDLADLKEPPPWIIAEMKLQAEQRKRGGMLKKRNNRYHGRSEDEYAEMIQACLDVMPIEDFGGYEDWWPIGAAICTHLPNERGWDLFWGWSKGDEAFSDTQHEFRARRNWDAWVRNEQAEEGMKRGGYSFGTISHAADQYDQHRTRFKDGDLEWLQEIESPATKVQEMFLNHEQIMARVEEIEEIDNPSIRDHEFHLLGKAAGYLNGEPIRQLIERHNAWDAYGGGKPQTEEDRQEMDESREYIIPALLPAVWMLMITADAGAGKSTLAQVLTKHITQGIPINVKGHTKVPTKKCKVLWLNGDQGNQTLIDQFREMEIGVNVDHLSGWDIDNYNDFRKMQKENEYDVVIIDSLSGCSVNSQFSENMVGFAQPLRKLVSRNGTDFPGTCFIVLHHNNKNGEFRGSSAIKACCDESWNMRAATGNDTDTWSIEPRDRIISVEKSRDRREGAKFFFRLRANYTGHFGALEAINVASPMEYVNRVYGFFEQNPLRQVTKRVLMEEEITKAEESTVRKALSRLEKEGLIKVVGEVRERPQGSPSKVYGLVGVPMRRFGTGQSAQS